MDEKIWDAGPQPPVRPTKPQVLLDAVDLPPGVEGDPAIEPATRKYAEAYRAYLQVLDEFPKIRAEWEKRNGTAPVQISVFSAAEAVARDPARFCHRLPASVTADA